MDCCFPCLGAKKKRKPPAPAEKPQIPPAAGDPPAPLPSFLLSSSPVLPDHRGFARPR